MQKATDKRVSSLGIPNEKIGSMLRQIVSRLENGSVSVIKQDDVVIQINLREKNSSEDS
ncbi:MAG: YezD family protein [Clostridiales Family XIII bacterium]|jgi:hypothetical protein|nr:YezD family protein [Clostridiales Family XIII bacterium]